MAYAEAYRVREHEFRGGKIDFRSGEDAIS
jgi:hypothetical protein